MNPFNPVLPTVPPEVQAANSVLMGGNVLLQQLTAQYQNSYNLVWNNARATPDRIVAAMGTQALNLFTRSARLAAYLVGEGANVPLTSPAAWTVTFHEDGSATAVKAG